MLIPNPNPNPNPFYCQALACLILFRSWFGKCDVPNVDLYFLQPAPLRSLLRSELRGAQYLRLRASSFGLPLSTNSTVGV